MNFSTVTSIVLALLGKRQEIAAIFTEVMSLIGKIKTIWPNFAPQLSQAQAQIGSAAAATDYSVAWLQESLNKLINAGLKVDGSYGEMTRAAIKKFQEANKLEADGWAGIETQAAIFNALK